MTGLQYKQARIQMKLTQKELADEMGISERQVQRREADDAKISYEAELALNVLYDEIVGMK